MPSKTAVPYMNAWVITPTLASASGMKAPSNQHSTGRPAGRAPASADGARFSVNMGPSIDARSRGSEESSGPCGHEREVGDVEGPAPQEARAGDRTTARERPEDDGR